MFEELANDFVGFLMSSLSVWPPCALEPAFMLKQSNS